MRPRIHREFFSLLYALLTACLMLVGPMIVRAEPAGGSILIRENFNSKNRAELIAKLRAVTGWSGLDFDSEGLLRVEGEAKTGSSAARDLVRQALSGSHLIVLEEVNKSSEIAFSRVTSAPWGVTPSELRQTHLLQIDFTDFGYLFGDRQARNAFDVGWAVLHELDHIVNDSEDASSLESAGECETNVNAMRRELELPERARYFYTFAPTNRGGLLKSRLVRLPFELRDAQTKKTKRFWLLWDAEIVGGSRALKEIAAIR